MSKQLRLRCNTGQSVIDVNALLMEQPLTSLPVKHYGNTNFPCTIPATDPDATVPFGQTWVNTVTRDGGVSARRRESLILWEYERFLKGGFHDLMTYFWRNHFGADFDNVNGAGIIEPNFCWQYYLCIRNNAMGNFRTFVRQMATNSGMMVRLNVEGSGKSSPNKNFARELLELFTLGEGNYTEQDVNEVARIMTGFYNDYNSTITSVVSVDPKNHDFGDKQFSSFFGNVYLAPMAATTENAFSEVNNLIDMIFRMQPQAIAKHICRKLYRFFISRDIDNTFVAQMCDVFVANNWELKPLLRFMLTSQHFADAQFQGCIVKSPVEVVANAIRDFKIKFPTDVLKKHVCLFKLRVRLMSMQDIGNPPSIAGWEAYRQAPDYDKVWYNSSSATERDRILVDLFDQSKFSFNGEGFWIDPLALGRSYTTPSDPNALVRQVLDMLPFAFTAAEQQAVKSQCLLNGGANDAFWTNAWNGYIAGNAANTQTVRDNLTKLFRWVITHESYQLK